MRTENEIFNDLSELCQSPGYIHAFAWLCFRDTVVGFGAELKPADMARLFSNKTLIRTELTTLHGLMIRRPIDFMLPDQKTLGAYVSRSDGLLAELHDSMNQPMVMSLQSIGQVGGINPLSQGALLREAIFYGAESAYTFQYRDFAPLKYHSDREWLESNRGFDMLSAQKIVSALSALLNTRLMDTLRALREKPQEAWTMLPGFAFTGQELADATNLPLSRVKNFLSAFSGSADGCNKDFTSLSAFNAAYEFPLVKKQQDEYLLFQAFGITEAIYDSPFYWMGKDDAYKKISFENRGRFTEEFCFDRLKSVFGSKRVYKNVEILRGKNALGEIDVLVLFGDQAVLVQAKSKKLTLGARSGNDLQLKGDFKAAVQDAVAQAFHCGTFLGDPTVTLRCRDGTTIKNQSKPKTIYPLTVIPDHYPALAFQARQFLKFEATDQIVAPLVIDVFALDAMTEMLNTPLRLLSYIRLRAKFADRFLASHEHTLLSYHLVQNLWLGEYDMAMIGDDFSSELDVAMAARRDGIPGAKTPRGILTAFENTAFSRILAQIEDEADPAAIALGFHLLELSGDTVKTLNRNIGRILELLAEDGGSHDVTMGLGDGKPGLTIHVNNRTIDDANRLLLRHCEIRKYCHKSSEWHGLSLRSDGSIRLAGLLCSPWKFDPELEVIAAKMPTANSGFRPARNKIGRNDRCPCGNGKKFKKCHGMN